MKIAIDRDLCEGNALCVKAAPEVFRIDDDDYAELLIPEPGPEHLARVKEAVRRCPRAALEIVEE
jgi:ferredoxin